MRNAPGTLENPEAEMGAMPEEAFQMTLSMMTAIADAFVANDFASFPMIMAMAAGAPPEC